MGYKNKTISSPSLIKDIDGKKGIITGYGSVFNNEDSDGDTIIPGAFTKTIAERGPQSTQPRIKYLRNHNVYEPVGVLNVLREDQKGLYYEAQAGTHNIGIDTIKMIESGLITEHSIGFETVRKQVIDPNADWKDRKQILQELKLWEISALTSWGANELTGGATVKGLTKDYIKTIQDRQIALEKFCKNTDATDETIELLLLEAKQLSQIILDLKATAPETPTPPNEGRNSETSTLPEGITDALTTFKKSLILN
jgi:HK97 family phage prohead protease